MRRALACECLDEVYLATADTPNCDPLEALGQEHGWKVIRGSEPDILARIGDVLAQDPADIIARITADNVAICPEVVEHGVQTVIEQGLDITSPFLAPNTYPFGAGCEVSTRNTLERLLRDTVGKDPSYREHVHFWAYDHPDDYKYARLEAPGAYNRSDISVTVDTPEEFEIMTAIYEHLAPSGSLFSLDELIRAYEYVMSRDGQNRKLTGS